MLIYFKEFNRNVDLALAKKGVIIMISRCLVHLGEVDLAKKFFDEVDNNVRQEYLQRKTSANNQVKANFDMLVIAKTELDTAIKLRQDLGQKQRVSN